MSRRQELVELPLSREESSSFLNFFCCVASSIKTYLSRRGVTTSQKVCETCSFHVVLPFYYILKATSRDVLLLPAVFKKKTSRDALKYNHN
jgi:hypothetical protein